jgi:phosphoketolase
LTCHRTNHDNIRVRGYKEGDTLTTPFDMTILHDLDGFHLVMDTIDRLPETGNKGLRLKQQLRDKLIEHKQYIANTVMTCRKSATGAGVHDGPQTAQRNEPDAADGLPRTP